MVKRVWTLTQRLGLGIGLALLIMGLILAITGYLTVSNLFEQHLRERVESQARQLALFSADAILVYDYGTLERYVKSLAEEPGILSVAVHRKDGELLAESGSSEIIPGTSMIEVKEVLQIGESDIGIVKLAVDRQGMETSLKHLVLVGLVVLLGLIAVLFWALHRFVDRGLIWPVQQLAEAANPLNQEKCPEPEGLPEELARLAETFRGLCGQIQAHLSEREHAEQLVRSATERLNREQRLATVGQIAAGLAHNLNTPLGSIRGYAQLLTERLEDPKHRRHAKLIAEQAESCADTVRNLLTTVRPPDVMGHDFDLLQQVQKSVELMRPLLRDRGMAVLDPVLEYNEDACFVHGDPGSVEQILFNLLTNAAQAGASEVIIRLIHKVDGERTSLYIQDNGPGIASVLHDTLFDPFVTDKPAGEGTGLGLYLSQQLARDMGARLVLADKTGGTGACFILQFGPPQKGDQTQ